MNRTERMVSLRLKVTEVRNDRGELVGAVSAVAVPGVAARAPLEPALGYVGWAHDWHNTDDDLSGRYIPLFVGGSDDPDTLLAEIEKRAHDAQESGVSPDITKQSLELFLAYARDAGNWAGQPLIGGNVGGSAEDRGNLTQLKRAGLLTTFKHEGETWIDFTEAGRKLAAEHGVELGKL